MSSLSILTLAPLLIFAFITTLVGIWRLKWAYVTAIIGVALSLIAASTGFVRVLQEGALHHYL